MYGVSFQSKLWRNGLTYGKRLVRLHSDYIKRTFHDRTVLQQSHQLSPKHIQQINLKEEENPNSKIEGIAIVVPVSNPSASSIIDTATAANHDEKLLKNDDSKASKKTKNKEPEWTVTPSEDLSKLGKHYLMLSKSRLTCKIIIIVERCVCNAIGN